MYALLPILICAILPTLLLRNFWANDCTKNATQWAKAHAAAHAAAHAVAIALEPS